MTLPPNRRRASPFNGPLPASITALVSGLAWLVKFALIDANGGPRDDEGFWIPATYLLGLLTLVAAGGLAGWALTRSRPVWLRLVATAVGAVGAFGLHRAMHAIGTALYTTDNWQRDEVSIWTTAVLMLMGGIAGLVVGMSKARASSSTSQRDVLQ